MPSYIVAKLNNQVIVKRNRGENRKLLTLGIPGRDVFEIQAGSKEKALKKGLDLFPAQLPTVEKGSTVGSTPTQSVQTT